MISDQSTKTYDVVCVGSSVVDIPLQPVDKSVFDTVSYPVDDISMHVGGDALNESIVLSRLGANVALVSAVGNDAAGQFIVKTAKDAGVDTTGINVKNGMTTSLNVGLIRPDGERTFVTNRNGSLWTTTESDICADPFLHGSILAFGSIYNNPLLKGPWLESLFQKAHLAGMTVCADMVPSRVGEGLDEIRSALAFVDYFFPNADEAMTLTGTRTYIEAAQALIDTGITTVVMKLGSRGCLVHTRESSHEIPAFIRDDLSVIDTTGAGDNFASGFICALLDGEKTSEECALFANAVAAVSVAGLGATSAVQSRTQIEKFISTRTKVKENNENW